MESFRIRTTPTLADWQALQRAVTDRLQWGVAAQPRDGGPYLAPCEFELSANGIGCVQQAARSYIPWQYVIDVTATAEHIFIWLEEFSGYIIPVRNLPEGVTAEQVVAACKQWMSSPATQEPAWTPTTADIAVGVQAAPAETAQAQSPWRTVFRLLTLRSVDHPGRPTSALSGKPLPIAVLALVSLALWAGLSWVYYEPDVTFFPYGAPALSWYVLAALAVAVTMAKRSRPQVAISQVCSLLAIALPVLLIADFAVMMWVPEQWASIANGILALYAIVYCALGMQALTGNRQPLAILGAVAVATLFIWVGIELYVYPSVWATEESEEYADTVETDTDAAEALLFDQPARIDAAVARIEPATGAAPAAFFVGFAGDGEQRVFAEEIKFAAGKFAERYETADRSLLLLNDRRDIEGQPLATVSSLSYALKALASRMRLDRDVLFLALSSHGSEDPLLSVQNGALPLRDLTGDALAEALGSSGIKWRVIVISACHSGAFIEPLRNPHTIVITAASPERTSFGCSDDRELTYFGEAFFRDSLPLSTSLRDAFDTATKLVGQREAAEGFEASHPQAFFGDQIEPRLASMLRAARKP